MTYTLLILIVVAVFVILFKESQKQAIQEVASLGGLRTIFYSLDKEIIYLGYEFKLDLGSSIEYKKTISSNSYYKIFIRKKIDLIDPYEIQLYKFDNGNITYKSTPCIITPSIDSIRGIKLISKIEGLIE